MDAKLIQDIKQFFFVYENRTEDLVDKLPKPLEEKFKEEFEFLKESVLNRLVEEIRR